MVEKKLINRPHKTNAERTKQTHKLYRTGDILSITVSPSDLFQFAVRDNDRKTEKRMQSYTARSEQFIAYWKSIFRGWIYTNLISEYEMYMEISKKGRLHWHGIIVIKKPHEFAHTMYYYNYFSPTEAFIDVDTIDDLKLWTEYCTKDYDIMGVKLMENDDDLTKPKIKAIKPFTGFNA